MGDYIILGHNFENNNYVCISKKIMLTSCSWFNELVQLSKAWLQKTFLQKQIEFGESQTRLWIPEIIFRYNDIAL